MAKNLLAFLSILLIYTKAFAGFIVGGDLSVKPVNNNVFEVTLELFRDCNSTEQFDTIQLFVGVYQKVSPQPNNYYKFVPMFKPVISTVTVGDKCYKPNLCIQKAVYVGYVTLADDTNGYYISYHRYCRTGNLKNITGEDGFTTYCEIPNPTLNNSTPVFNNIPDAYLCSKHANLKDFSATDADGDSLVYDIVDPYSCSSSTNVICGPTQSTSLQQKGTNDPGIWPKPYGIVDWANGYNKSNPFGDPGTTINPATGMITTTPPDMGVFLVAVRVQEYRNSKKIGEVRRDFEYESIDCWDLNISSLPSLNICLGGNATLTATGAPAGFTYKWAPGGQTTSSIVVTSAVQADYTYTVTATNGVCTAKAMTTVHFHNIPNSSTVTADNIACFGGAGSATVIPSGGTSPYSYEWQTSPIQTSISATGLLPGNYTVIITDANKCLTSKTVAITQPSTALTSTLTSTEAGCNIATGTASVVVSGGTPGYTYLWNTTPPQTTALATGILSGSYSVLVTDNNGCTKPGTIYIPVANGPTVTATVVSNVSCFGTNNGSATTSSTVGGALPYTYLWLPTNQTTDTATSLYAQTYTIYVTDHNNCKSFSTVTVEQPNILNLKNAITVTNVSCYMGTNGTATISPTGGTRAYSYLWSTLPTQTDSVAAGLSANTVYSVTVTDSKGCTSTASVTLTQPTKLISGIENSTMPSCFGYADGMIRAVAAGGTPQYTYNWLPSNQTTSLATGLAVGDYTVTITDAHGCGDTTKFTLTQPTAVAISATSSGFSCAGVSRDGSASSLPSGGTPPYSYAWHPTSQTTQSISNISAGTYSVTMTDAKGCSITTSTTLGSSDKPDAKFSFIPSVSCEGVIMNFMDESTPAASITTWMWNFGNGVTSTIQNPSQIFPYNSGGHNVTLVVYQPPCYDTIISVVNANDLYNYATFNAKTNIFTPNGDDVNECFRPYLGGKGADALMDCLELKVYDRWGVLMFNSKGNNNCWDGTNLQNKKPAVDGTYFYIATVAGKTIKGYCTLIRK